MLLELLSFQEHPQAAFSFFDAVVGQHMSALPE
jgi:hypothetical protein